MTISSETKTATSVHDVVYDELAERYAREPKQACSMGGRFKRATACRRMNFSSKSDRAGHYTASQLGREQGGSARNRCPV